MRSVASKLGYGVLMMLCLGGLSVHHVSAQTPSESPTAPSVDADSKSPTAPSVDADSKSPTAPSVDADSKSPTAPSVDADSNSATPTVAPKAVLTRPSKVTIEFRVEPRWARAEVYHGKKRLGKTPLKVDRKWNSGPLDIWVKAGGFIPVNTRAYTFKDDKIIIQLTPDEDANTLFGYKAPLVPEDEVPVGGSSETTEASPPAVPEATPALP